jgi:hypothetical protein
MNIAAFTLLTPMNYHCKTAQLKNFDCTWFQFLSFQAGSRPDELFEN